MSLPTDQNPDSGKLSATSRKMLALRDMVLAEWEKRVRATLAEAKELRPPIVLNTMPIFYDNLAESLSPGYPRANAVEGTTLAYEHGSERARMTQYDPEALILEYQIFRSTLLEVLESNHIELGKEEFNIINASIDESIRQAVMSFSAMVMAFRQQFMAALTHDMRTPLNTASMTAELIFLTADSPKLKELARRIIQNIERVGKMAEGLLDSMVFSQGQKLSLEMSNFDILEVVNDVVASSNNRLRCDVTGEPVQGWWSLDAMRRALENLIGNAMKYGDSQYPITIHVSKSDGSLVLSIHNKGLPIPVEDQEGVFQVFRRASNVKAHHKQGWGIGLPYVRAVSESHGGSVTLDSALERGTTFTLVMPVDARPFQNAAVSG
jgi:signal transduction histidine kinase